MVQNVFFAVQLDPITRAEYYDARKPSRYVSHVKPQSFVYSRNNIDRLLYITDGGKFYKGTIRPDQDVRQLDTFEFLYVLIKKPEAVWRRKPMELATAEEIAEQNKAS